MAATKRRGKRNPGVGVKPGKNLKQVLRDIPKLIRTDFGGADRDNQIGFRLSAEGVPVNPDTISAYLVAAKATRDTIKSYIVPQVDHARDLLG